MSKLPIYSDSLTRRLYANDASMYEELPNGVCFPGNTADLQDLVHTAKAQGQSITARAAGTSLAGQTTGGGIIADVSRFMDAIIEINPNSRKAIVQPGVIRDQLNREAAKHGLYFGPDTSTTNRCMLGGMIGNNSAGSYSIKYGSTREHILEIEAVLSDANKVTFGPLTPEELEEKKSLQNLEGEIYRGMVTLLEENRELITERFPHPDVKRRNSGYALDKLLEMHPFTPNGRPFNLAELLCGSEGTLALTASATVNLVPLHTKKALVIPHFKTLKEAMEATVKAVTYEPAAVELLDKNVLDATKLNIEQKANRFFLKGDPEFILIIEFEGSSAEEMLNKAELLVQVFTAAGMGYAHPVLHANDEMKRVWDLRKAGLGLLMGLGDDAKTPSFAEDTAVRVEDLPAYTADFEKLLQKYNTKCVFYAHASVGELHLRPVFNLAKSDDISRMKEMMTEVTDLVKSYRGSLSGEHGDGRNRSPFLEQFFGSEIITLFRKVKSIWDPEGIFNPGKIVNPLPMDEGLRVNPDKPIAPVETVFKWRDAGGFHKALELCNGAGVCRKRADSGGTMCPSYMATLDEKDSTRGRANIFRQVFTEGTDSFSSSDIHEALKLCLSCKACKSECPANVDMARMKAEFMQGWHEEKGIKPADRFWMNPLPLLKLGSITPVISNAVASSGIVKSVMASVIGLHPERALPKFAKNSFHSWLKQHEHIFREDGDVILWVDEFTNLHHPEHAIAAVKVLEKLGYRQVKPIIKNSGRTFISGGMPKKALASLRELYQLLKPYQENGVKIVGLEPSEVLTIRDEFPDLCTDDDRNNVLYLAENTFLFEEFIAQVHPQKWTELNLENHNTKVLLHVHCYVKALTQTKDFVRCLELCGYDVEVLDSGCCGMAGSFGYKKDTYEVSMKIANQRLLPAVNKADELTIICTHGFSCKHQIQDGSGRKVNHPAELVAKVLVGN